jgi:hypothetical protein
MNLGGEIGRGAGERGVCFDEFLKSRGVLEGVDRHLTAHRIRAFGEDEQDCPGVAATGLAVAYFIAAARA